MTRSRQLAIVLMALVALFSGCVRTELRVTNRTDGSIQFYTGHTKKAVQIQAGATVSVPHTAGRVIIITQQDEVWVYDSVDVFDFPSETTKGYKRLTVAISVAPDGMITLQSGRKIQPSPSLRPEH